MGQFKVLNLFKPARRIIPDVSEPDSRVPFKKKFVNTLACLGIFLVCSQLPLYGIKASTGADPLYWARMIMASSRGTVMELGTGPIITAGMIVQLLVGSKVIDVDNSIKSDRELMYVPMHREPMHQCSYRCLLPLALSALISVSSLSFSVSGCRHT